MMYQKKICGGEELGHHTFLLLLNDVSEENLWRRRVGSSYIPPFIAPHQWFNG
jgi:hypothetical protein